MLCSRQTLECLKSISPNSMTLSMSCQTFAVWLLWVETGLWSSSVQLVQRSHHREGQLSSGPEGWAQEEVRTTRTTHLSPSSGVQIIVNIIIIINLYCRHNKRSISTTTDMLKQI